MQVKVYRRGDSIVVDMCTQEQPRVVAFEAAHLDRATVDNPVWLTFPDIHGSSIFTQRLSEMGSVEQDRVMDARIKQRDDGLRADGKKVPGEVDYQTVAGPGGHQMHVGEAASSAQAPMPAKP